MFEKFASFKFFYFSYLFFFREKKLSFFFLLAYLLLRVGVGPTANSFLCNLFFLALNSERYLLTFACCVSLLSDQAMLTFVQINLIKF